MRKNIKEQTRQVVNNQIQSLHNGIDQLEQALVQYPLNDNSAKAFFHDVVGPFIWKLNGLFHQLSQSGMLNENFFNDIGLDPVGNTLNGINYNRKRVEGWIDRKMNKMKYGNEYGISSNYGNGMGAGNNGQFDFNSLYTEYVGIINTYNNKFSGQQKLTIPTVQ